MISSGWAGWLPSSKLLHVKQVVIPPYPGNFSALHSEGTRVPGRPDQVLALGHEYAPEAGATHRLGGGLALAWVKDDRVCLTTGVSSGCAGRLD
jgi:hypothetical protein